MKRLLQPAPPWTARAALYSIPFLLWELWAAMTSNLNSISMVLELCEMLEQVVQ